MRCALTWWGGLRPLIYTMQLGPQSVVGSTVLGRVWVRCKTTRIPKPGPPGSVVRRRRSVEALCATERQIKGRRLTQTANKDEPFLSEKNTTPVIRTSLQCGHEKFCPS